MLLRWDTSKDTELMVLRHENAMLRRQVKGRIRYEPVDRFWLAALPSLLPQVRPRVRSHGSRRERTRKGPLPLHSLRLAQLIGPHAQVLLLAVSIRHASRLWPGPS